MVPKININEDGSLGEPNDVTLVSIEDKMGFRQVTMLPVIRTIPGIRILLRMAGADIGRAGNARQLKHASGFY